MSSRRFPGKVLSPFLDRPMISRVLDRCREAGDGQADVVLTTSTHPTDDPLQIYVTSLGYPVYRGPLDNVLLRMHQAALHFGADWVVRVSGDSPCIDPSIIRLIMSSRQADDDIVTNVHPRSFPKGQSVEMLSTALLARILDANPSAEDCEHVTPWAYRHADQLQLRNVRNPAGDQSGQSHVIDTLDDLRRQESLAGQSH